MEFSVGIPGLIWTICLIISDHFWPIFRNFTFVINISPFLVKQFSVGIPGIIWTICLIISDLFWPFRAVFGYFGVFFVHLGSICVISVYYLGGICVFGWYLSDICVIGWYLCMGGMAFLGQTTM